MNKSIFCLLFILFAPTVNAEDYVGPEKCHGVHVLPTTIGTDFPPIIKRLKISWFGANQLQVAHAPCRGKIPSSEELDSYIDGLSNGGQSQIVNGVNLQGESPAMIKLFEDLVILKDIIGDPLETQINLQDKFAINPECQKVKCAVEKIFGNEVGDKIIYLKQKYGFNASYLAFEDSGPVNKYEIDRMIKAVEDVPEFLLPLDTNQRMTIFDQEKTPENDPDGNTIANAQINFFDSWDKLGSAEMMEYIVYHEVGHYIADELGLDSHNTWAEVGGWSDLGDGYVSSRPECFVSEYAKSNIFEDFTETFTAYRYNPNLLLTNCPEKYEYMKQVVYQGIEFRKQSTFASARCSAGTYLDSLSSLGLHLGPRPLTPEILARCKNEYVSFLADTSISQQSLFSCYANALGKISAGEQILATHPELLYPELTEQVLMNTSSDYSHLLPGNLQEAELAKMNNEIVQKMVDHFVKWDQDGAYHYSPYSKESKFAPAEFCEEWTVDNQAWQIFDEAFTHYFGDELLAYENKEKLNQLAYNFCVNIQMKKPVRSPMIASDFIEQFSLL